MKHPSVRCEPSNCSQCSTVWRFPKPEPQPPTPRRRGHSNGLRDTPIARDAGGAHRSARPDRWAPAEGRDRRIRRMESLPVTEGAGLPEPIHSVFGKYIALMALQLVFAVATGSQATG